MDQVRKVQELWAWLPAFRVVAETEHLPTAAERLGVAASSLSRAVKQLETEMGMPLFHRVGRRIVLNDAGRLMLRKVRDAMRLVDDGLAELQGELLTGPVRVATSGLATRSFVLPALLSIQADDPDLEVHLGSIFAGEAVRHLTHGTCDVVVQSTPIHDERIASHMLGHAFNSIWCGPGHPLYGRRDVTVVDVQDHAFTAPPGDALGRTPEGWPDDLERRVQWHVERMDLGVEICAAGRALAVLPDVVAKDADVSLWRVPLELIPPTPVLAFTRNNLGTRGKAERVVDAVRRAVEAAADEDVVAGK